MRNNQIPMLIGWWTIIVTLTCSTCWINSGINDAVISINQRFDELDLPVGDINLPVNGINQQVRDSKKRIDDLETDVRELRSLLIDSIRKEQPEN